MTSHVVSGLQRKREQLASQVLGLERDLSEARIALAHVDATLLIFASDDDVDHAISPDDGPADPPLLLTTTRPRRGRPPGPATQAVFAVIREAERPLMAREIAERAARRIRFTTASITAWKKHQATVNATLYRQRELGVLKTDIDERGYTVWATA